MAARKKAIPQGLIAEGALTGVGSVLSADLLAPGPVPGVRYQSIRLKEQGHKLRFSHTPLKVEATDTQTITFLKEPFAHFRVDPGGVEFPIENVSSALRIDSGIAQKLSRTGRINERKLAVLKASEAKRQARAAAEVENVDDEDNDPLPSDGDSDE